MATTSPDNLRTPDPGSSYNLVSDLATLAGDVQSALNTRANVYKGTTTQRTSFTSTAVPGMLWQDTDGIRMLWKRGASAWEPAVWRWVGTTAQMNSFGASAPNGFEWHDPATEISYIKIAGGWAPMDRAKVSLTLAAGFTNEVGVPEVWMRNGVVTVVINAFRAGWNNLQTITTLPTWARPAETIPGVGIWASSAIELKILPSGAITGNPGATARNGVIGHFSYAVSPKV